MTSDQQSETRAYFSEHAEEWHAAAVEDSGPELNTLKQRYHYVEMVAKRQDPMDSFLDFGCGSGELVALMAARIPNCTGVDFTAEMIAIAKSHARETNVAEKCIFEIGSALEYSVEPNSLDMITGLGLIEYFSPEELRGFMDRCYGFLKDDGIFLLESRNRLFNLVTFNDYTKVEHETGNFDALVHEAEILMASGSMSECIAALQASEITPDNLSRYPVTGVPVTLRHQYTPGQLTRLLTECGFEVASFTPYHYHAAAPRFADANPALHARLAGQIQNHIWDCHYVTPQASSFMIYGQKS